MTILMLLLQPAAANTGAMHVFADSPVTLVLPGIIFDSFLLLVQNIVTQICLY